MSLCSFLLYSLHFTLLGM
ncbi:hypothetical protein E2C01_101289 [Portunus trituberculatus]|uniref:Uncharacterized protein n=1 Tax=Portunus trituberculatus TaxID=210409 RepID=A0A5B7K970_PORTR|nr:hypothetical protein [Portunus trituberculatus]